jgi:agmatine deiminase
MRSSTPRSLGYRMPAEWEPQSSVWLAWPTNPDTWSHELISEVRQVYTELIAVLSVHQTVSLLVDQVDDEQDVGDTLAAAQVNEEAVRFLQVPTVDTWVRDYGPTFLINDSLRQVGMVKWGFNAWGGKYDDLIADGGVPDQLNRFLDLAMFEAGFVLEGGSIEVNGRGTVLTTEQCLLNPNRNPDLSRSEIEEGLKEFLSAPNVVWLTDGIEGDDTDGHIDDIARFIDERTVLCAVEEDPADSNYQILEDNHERLSLARDQDGRGLNVLKLPMPDQVAGPHGRLPVSYANFYIGNRTVIVPVFGQRKDRTALDLIQRCFPQRRVVGIDSTALVHGLGGIHCCTQQQPMPHI